MTRKDYVLIAEAINESMRLTDDREAQLVLSGLVTNLQDRLKADNPRFDVARFREAALTTPQEATA